MRRSRHLPTEWKREKQFVSALSYLGTYAADRQEKLDRFVFGAGAAPRRSSISAGRIALPLWLESGRRTSGASSTLHPTIIQPCTPPRALRSTSRGRRWRLPATARQVVSSRRRRAELRFLPDDWEGLRRVLRSEARAASRADAGRCSGLPRHALARPDSNVRNEPGNVPWTSTRASAVRWNFWRTARRHFRENARGRR